MLFRDVRSGRLSFTILREIYPVETFETNRGTRTGDQRYRVNVASRSRGIRATCLNHLRDGDRVTLRRRGGVCRVTLDVLPGRPRRIPSVRSPVARFACVAPLFRRTWSYVG